MNREDAKSAKEELYLFLSLPSPHERLRGSFNLTQYWFTR